MAHTEWELDTKRMLPRRLSNRGYDTHLFRLQYTPETPEECGYDQIHTAGRLSPNVFPGIGIKSVNRCPVSSRLKPRLKDVRPLDLLLIYPK